ncbi:hypothetical protein DFH11DRAFT_1549207 [Phellopilus nigrolimitatus]|nr:hypothetical protein DFH11DRAFT_1549207 [Phellopilus nigrolimitatus]
MSAAARQNKVLLDLDRGSVPMTRRLFFDIVCYVVCAAVALWLAVSLLARPRSPVLSRTKADWGTTMVLRPRKSEEKSCLWAGDGGTLNQCRFAIVSALDALVLACGRQIEQVEEVSSSLPPLSSSPRPKRRSPPPASSSAITESVYRPRLRVDARGSVTTSSRSSLNERVMRFVEVARHEAACGRLRASVGSACHALPYGWRSRCVLRPSRGRTTSSALRLITYNATSVSISHTSSRPGRFVRRLNLALHCIIYMNSRKQKKPDTVDNECNSGRRRVPTLKYTYNAKETKGNGGEMREIVVLVVPHDEHDYLGVASGGGSRRRAVLMATSRVDHRRGQRRRSARGDAAVGDGE